MKIACLIKATVFAVLLKRSSYHEKLLCFGVNCLQMQ